MASPTNDNYVLPVSGPLSAGRFSGGSVNQAPVWAGVPSTLQITQGGTLNIQGYASDPNGDALTFALESGTLPTGVTFNNGVFTAASGAALGAAGSFTVSADDGVSAPAVPAGTVTVGTIYPTSTTVSVPFSYSASDQTGFVYSFNGGATTPWAASPLTQSGLTPSTPYTVKIAAKNAAGNGAWSTLANFTTGAAMAPPSGAVTIGAITPTAGGASVAFTYSGSDQTGFVYRLNGGSPIDAGTTSPLVMFALGSSVGYTIEIAAKNSAGNGAWSTAASFTTGALIPGALPTFGMTSAAGGAQPFAFGHVFKEGDVPAGSYVTTSDLSEFESEPRNYWGDGSLKFAVLKGSGAFTASVKKNVQLSTTATAPSGAMVAQLTTGDVGTTNVVFGAMQDASYDPAVPMTVKVYIAYNMGTGYTVNSLTPTDSGAGSTISNLAFDVATQVVSYTLTGGDAGQHKIRVLVNTTPSGGGAADNWVADISLLARTGGGMAWDAANKIMTPANGTTIATATLSLASAISGADLTSFAGTATVQPASAGRVRVIQGRQMTEEHFYAPHPGSSLCVWWYVRKYKTGQIEIETAVEQAWFKVLGQRQLGFTVTVNVNGVAKYSSALEHLARCRWSRIDWVGTDPQVTPTIDGMYWRSTKMVPNYMPEAPSSTALDALIQTASVFDRYPLNVEETAWASGPFGKGSAGGGEHNHLGILPQWEAALIKSNCDPRAYRAMLVGEQCESWVDMASGGNAIYRDETTLQPVSLNDIGLSSMSNTSSPTNGSGFVAEVNNTDEQPWSTDMAHGVAAGYLAYLITGRWYSLEASQMYTAAESIALGRNGASPYQKQRWMYSQDRSVAWGLRSISCALAITPETIANHAPYRASMVLYVQDAMDAWTTVAVGTNNLGLLSPGDHAYGLVAGNAGVQYALVGSFQEVFVSQCFGFINDIVGHTLNTTARDQMLAAAKFHGKWPTGLAGDASGWCYRRAGWGDSPADMPAATYSGGVYTWLNSFAEVYAATKEVGYIPAEETCGASDTLIGGFFPSAGSYWGNFLPALAYAVDLGVPGAAAGWERVTGASNYGELQVNFADNAPHFGIIPRTP